MFGFGNGNRVRHGESPVTLENGNRAQKIFSNDMVCHVWAQRTQTFGQSGNGNLYFHGRALYSYGSHYVAGYVLPANGESLTGQSVGVTLLNADSNSVTTNRHVSNAYSAARGRAFFVPSLTEIARELMAIEGGSIKSNNPARIQRVRAEMVSQVTYGEAEAAEQIAEAAPYIFRAMGDSEKKANGRTRGLLAEGFRKAAANAKAKADREHKARLRRLANAARTKPASLALDILRDAKDVANDSDSAIEARREEWREESRELFRAIKAGKKAGQSARVRHAQLLRRTIRESLPLFDSYRDKARRLHVWSEHKRNVRNVLAGRPASTLSDTETRYRGRGAAVMTGHGEWAYTLREGARSARIMADALSRPAGDTRDPWAARPAGVVGIVPHSLASRLERIATAAETAAEAAEAADRRAQRRNELAALRGALEAAEDKAADPSVRVKAMKAGRDLCAKYARKPYSWQREQTESGFVAGYHALPGAWRVCGWHFSTLGAIGDSLASEIDGVETELRRLAAEEREKAEAMAREAWHEFREADLPLELRRIMPRKAPEGGAMLRAKSVTRDSNGEIDGGILETSQSASVPLTHALRVFRFLRHCRDRGEAWEANGRTLRVGHFRVDSVDAAGNFRAGCHSIQWAEVARLAAALGVEAIAAADTTETR